MHHLAMTCSGPLEEALSFLFQRGILVPVTSGTPMADFLLCSLDIPREYFQERIQTIFLDGRPVDDPAASVVGPGSSVALSASLPGLAGATMRKGGQYACFRSSISHKEAAATERGGEAGFATLKLFNLLIGELGTRFLQRGVLVPAPMLVDLLRSGDMLGQCRRVELDDDILEAGQLLDRLASMDDEPLRVRMASM
jgi:hypothetical protein